MATTLHTTHLGVLRQQPPLLLLELVRLPLLRVPGQVELRPAADLRGATVTAARPWRLYGGPSLVTSSTHLLLLRTVRLPILILALLPLTAPP